MEDYLKAIYALDRKGDGVRTSAVADYLHVAPASVTNMVQRLARQRLAAYARYRGTALTSSGRRIARAIIRRHRVIRWYLVEHLGVSPQTATREAEKLEHVLSTTTEARIVAALRNPSQDGDNDSTASVPAGMPVVNARRSLAPSGRRGVASRRAAGILAVGVGGEASGCCRR